MYVLLHIWVRWIVTTDCIVNKHVYQFIVIYSDSEVQQDKGNLQ